jgi:RNA polymerase sigma-70 factor (ECF subfamily)
MSPSVEAREDSGAERLEALMIIALRGDREAFAQLCELRRERLVSEVRKKLDRRLQTRVDASDVIQEVFIDADRRLPEMVDASIPLIAWLRFLANQKVVDLQRRHVGAKRRSVSRERSLSRPAFDLDSIAGQIMADISSPSMQAQQHELAACVKRTLADLSPLDREILVLRHFHEMANHEVAESLGLSINAASNRYVRALKRFKKVLDGKQDDLIG